MITVRELDIPTPGIDDQRMRDFACMIEVRNASAADAFGGDDSFAITLEEAVGTATNQEEERIRYFVGELDNRIVGRAYLEVSLRDNLATGIVEVLVHPAWRGRGVGSALGEHLRDVIAGTELTTLQAWVDHPPAEGARLESPTGFGSIPAETSAVRFLQRYGFMLGQIERTSSLDALAVRPELEGILAEAATAAADYELLTWVGHTPPEYLDSLAALHARMATDVPAGEMDIEPEEWDAMRLRNLESREDARGRTLLRAVARHRNSGEIVAYTVLVVPKGEGRPVYQEDTLVHGEHRGHRLGMLVKAGNLLQLAANFPDHTRVITWNAEENRHMLNVNEALGFAPIGYEGAWQRRMS